MRQASRAPKQFRYLFLLAALVAILATIYAGLEGERRRAFLRGVAGVTLVIMTGYMIATVRKSVKGQGSSLTEVARKRRVPTQSVPAELDRIHDEVRSSLKSRDYYAETLLQRLDRLARREGKLPWPVSWEQIMRTADAQPRTEHPEDRQTPPDRFQPVGGLSRAWGRFLGPLLRRGVEIEEIEEAISRIEEK